MNSAGKHILYGRILRARRLLRGIPHARYPYDAKFHVEAAMSAYRLVHAFYLFTLYIAFATLRSVYNLGASDQVIGPLWPIFWIHADNFQAATAVLGLGFVATSMAAVAWPGYRWPRVLVAFFGLQCFALENSFGSVNHYSHFWVWMAVCFAALPVVTAPDRLAVSRGLRQNYLAVFFATQLLIALFYTLSGAFKALRGIYVPDGFISSFAPHALPHLVVSRWLSTGEHPLLADLFINNLWLAWPAHLFVIYVELVALVAVFRPELHRLWGLALATFHISVWLLMGISFPYQPTLVALLFLCSPFHPRKRLSAAEVLRQLPLFGDALAFLRQSVPRLAPGKIG